MPIINHDGIKKLYSSKEKTKSVQFFYVHNCVVFMDALNVVAYEGPHPFTMGDNYKIAKIH